MKNKLILSIATFALVGSIAVYFVANSISTKNSSLEFARNQNNSVLNEMQSNNLVLLAVSKHEHCNRNSMFSLQNCQVVESRVYSVDNISNLENELSTQLKTSGWFSDFDSEPNKYFAANIPENSPLFLQGDANRNANNNDTGDSVIQTLGVLGTKEVPQDNNGYFQGTQFKYSEQTSGNLAEKIKTGKSLVFLTSYQKFTSLF